MISPRKLFSCSPAAVLGVAVVLMVLGAGCSDDPTEPPDPPDPPCTSIDCLTLPQTPDQLVAAVLDAWNNPDRTVEQLQVLLAVDFSYEFFQTDVDTSCIFAVYDRVQELDAVAAITNGRDGRLPLPSGQYRSAVLKVQPEFALLTGDQPGWQPSREAGLEDTQFRRYELRPTVFITFEGTEDTDWMDGFHEFFVLPVDDSKGQFAGYRLKLWRDLGFVPGESKRLVHGDSKRSEPVDAEYSQRKHRFFTWGYFRAIYGAKPDSSGCGS